MKTTGGDDSADEISEDTPPAENSADDSSLTRSFASVTASTPDCVIVSHTGDRSINHEERERERERELGKKSLGTKKEGKLSWNMFAWSWFLAKLECYLKSSSVQSRDWNVLLSQRWRESHKRCSGKRMVDGWKTSKQDHKHPSIPWVHFCHCFETELVCLYILNSPFLSLVFTPWRWFRRLISTVDHQ